MACNACDKNNIQTPFDPEFLNPCLGVKTHNPNESFYFTLCKYSAKNIVSGKNISEIAASIATTACNDGMKEILQIKEKLNLSVSKWSIESLAEKDKAQTKIRDKDIRDKASTYEARKNRKRKKGWKMKLRKC